MHFLTSMLWEEFSQTCRVKFSVLADIEEYWSIQVEMHFESSKSWDGFGHLKLRYILCPRRDRDGFLPPKLRCIFLSLFSWDGFVLHKLRYN